jgi:hypothetical protein
MLVLSQCFLFFYYTFVLNNSIKSIKSVSYTQTIQLLQNRNTRNHLKNYTNFDEYCNENGEWEMCGRFAYFKRSASYYFVDAGHLRLNLVLKNGDLFNFSVQILVFNGPETVFNSEIDSNSTILRTKWKIAEYEQANLDVKFNINQYLPKFNPHKLEMFVFVSDLMNGSKTEAPLRVKMKHLKDPNRAGSMICTKCLNLKNSDKDLISLRWWFEVNKRIGYSKIYLCNHTIDQVFADLFHDYKEILLVDKLECIPNLQGSYTNTEEKYFRSYLSLVYPHNRQYLVYKYELINQLILNECYLENVDRYKFITVIDIDETILPVKSTEFFKLDEMINYTNASQGNLFFK